MAKSYKISRRTFITSTVIGSSGLALSNFFSLKPLQASDGMKRPDLDGNTLIINIEDHPELKDIGSFKILKEVTIGEITDSIIIVKKSDTDYLVFSSVCRHKKCNVRYKKDRDLFVCPCHGSTYNMNGKVIKGPSQGDIPKYRVKVKDNKLEISI